jgi:glycosyltransferase involved in cell wall biosynthesis
MSSRIVFVEQFYYPDGWGGAELPRDVTTRLAGSGYDVEVICGSDPYAPVQGDPGPDPAQAGVRLRRVPRLLGRDIHHLKLLRQLWFCAVLLPMLLLRRPPAAFIVQTNPPLAVPLVAAAAWLFRRPFVVIAMDLYPEVIFAHGALRPGTFSARLLGTVFRWAYRRAATVVSLGPTMARRLVEKGVLPDRIVTISNWASGADGIVRGSENRLAAEWQLQGCFVLLYSGNLGIAHDVETPVRVVRELHAEMPELRLVFVGKGSRLDEARALARTLGVDDVVQFRPLVPAELLPHSLGLADLALVTLRPGFEGLVVPSKLLGYLARGVPTLYIGPPSDAQQLIEDAGAGACLPNGEVAALVRLLRDLSRETATLERMGGAGARFYAARLSRAVGLSRYVDVVDGITGRVGALQQ